MSQICRYYQKGTCKYGSSCHFIHENNYRQQRDYNDYSYGYNRGNYNENYPSYRNRDNENYSSYRNKDNETYSYKNRDNYPQDYSQNYNKSYNRYHVDHRQQTHQPEVKSSEELTLSQFIEVVRVELKEFEERHVWPLTVISPMKNYGNIPGFKDYSPEEIRYQFYLATSNNTFHEFKRSIDELKQNVFQCCSQFKNKSSAAYNIAKEMMSKSRSQFEESTPSVFQTSAPSTGFTFDLNALPKHNSGFSQTPQSFPSTSSFGAPQFGQNVSTFGPSDSVEVEFSSPSFPSQQPQNSQINSFSFNLSNLNSQNAAPAQPAQAQPSFSFADKPNIQQVETNPEYSKLSDLTPEQLQAFQAKTFKYGHVPLNSPPKELCY